MRLYSIHGVQVKLLTVRELAKHCNVSSRNLREWERKKILPRPTVTEPVETPVSKTGKTRLYTQEQAEVLKNWLIRFKKEHNLLVNTSQVQILHDDWYRATEVFIKTLKGENKSG